MIRFEGWRRFHTRWANRFAARLATRARPDTGFTAQPEPRTIGTFARGRQLIGGNYQFAGHHIESPGTALWELPAPHRAFEEELHGFAWLDDLAAVGDIAARERAQDWTFGWIDRYGRGSGSGWTPNLTGRRLIRWINHALLLLNGCGHTATEAYFWSLAQQTNYLSRRWHAAPPGLPRFEALTGLVYAGLALTGMERHVEAATLALGQECQREIDAEGGIPSRNPEELLEIFTLLNWATQALGEADRKAPRAHLHAVERIAPTLRSLRHADGGLARFHGGGRGAEGRLDHALATSGIRQHYAHGTVMGFCRLSGGRSTVIVDAAAPPGQRASINAHASTTAFELTSGRRPVIVNCGSGATFGAEWRRAGRATASHSALAIEGYSSSRLKRPQVAGRAGTEPLAEAADVVELQPWSNLDASGLLIAHNGYERTHGLLTTRQLALSSDGRALSGSDRLSAVTDAERRRFDRILQRGDKHGVAYALRFHLHPDVDAALDMGGTAVSLALKSGEIWVFRFGGRAELSLEPSVYLERGRLKPRATKQIVLAARIADYSGQIDWTLAKAQDTPQATRDLEREDPLAGV